MERVLIQFFLCAVVVIFISNGIVSIKLVSAYANIDPQYNCVCVRVFVIPIEYVVFFM